MIIDAFLYAGEAEMLDLRIQTLDPVVDAFLAVSADHTHQGDPAPPAGFIPHPKLRIHELRAEPFLRFGPSRVGAPGYQRIERAQRNAIRHAIFTQISADPEDLVLVSDVDEIPEPSCVAALPVLMAKAWAGGEGSPWACFEQRFHSTTLDQLHPAQPWLGTTASKLGMLRPQAMRDARGPDSKPFECFRIERGGWHFSWFGTEAERARKRDTISHGELRTGSWRCLECGRPEWEKARVEQLDPPLPCRFCEQLVGWQWFEPFDAQQRAVHSNGEELRLLSPQERLCLDWPEPIIDGSFFTPDAWNYSGKGGDIR